MWELNQAHIEDVGDRLSGVATHWVAGGRGITEEDCELVRKWCAGEPVQLRRGMA